MIQLTRINKTSLVLNADLIEHIETTPDTVISLTNGQKFVVRESAAEVMRKAVEYQRQIRQAREIPGVSPPERVDAGMESEGAVAEGTLMRPSAEVQR